MDPGTGPIDPGTSDTTGVTDSVAAPIVLLVDSLKWEELENKRTILYVDANRMESNDTVVNRDLRTFSTKELIKIKANSEGTGFCLTSWVCDTLNNVFLMAHPQGSGGSYILFYIDMLPPLAQFDYEIPYENGSLTIYNREDQPATIAPGDGTTFSIETEDPLWIKLRDEITVNWTGFFDNYANDSKYAPMTAIYAREWVVMLTNLAYMYSTPEFKHIMYNYLEVMNNNPIWGNNKKNFTQEQYEELYDNLRKDRTFCLGLVANTANGYGGGQTLAVYHPCYYSHYYTMKNAAWETVSHEINHCVGYNHDSNLTQTSTTGNATFPGTLVPQLHNWLRKAERLPYMNPKVFDFENKAYSEHWIGGITGLYEPLYNKSDFPPVETYFRNNPDWNQ